MRAVKSRVGGAPSPLKTRSGALGRGIQTVGVLFAAFGGFLIGVAPPEDADAKFAVGVSSFVALIVLFLCAALSGKSSRDRHRRTWVIVAVLSLMAFLAAASFYQSLYSTLTFEYPPGGRSLYVAGAQLTPDASGYARAHPGLSKGELLAKFGGLEGREQVWSAESTQRAHTELIAGYVILVLALSGAIFSLTEGLVARRK